VRAMGALALVVLGVLSSCGGGGDAAAPTQRVSTPARSGLSQSRYEAKVEAVCRATVRETRLLGRRLSAIAREFSSEGGLVLTTEGLVKPGARIRERMAARIRRLGPPPSASPALAAYVELFDPIDVLIAARLHAGLDNELGEANRFEQLAQHLGEEQRNDARNAGLDACAVDFVQVAFADTSSR
jgi:hypothetical protein